MTDFQAINWAHYQQRDMWRIIMSADPQAMFDEASKAERLASAMSDITDFVNGISQQVAGAWTGPAADQALPQIKGFLDWAAETSNKVDTVAGLLSTYAHVLNRARVSLPAPGAGNQQHAEHVMTTYADQSQWVYDQIGRQNFERPPGAGDLPAPAPEPAPDPRHDPSSLTTTTSSFVPAMTAPGGTGAPGLPLGSGGAFGGGAAGGGMTPMPGNGVFSGVGAMTAEAEELAPLAAAEEQAGWRGFAPTQGHRRAGDRDGEHHDRYSLSPDLIGELPPAFPPVLGV